MSLLAERNSQPGAPRCRSQRLEVVLWGTDVGNMKCAMLSHPNKLWRIYANLNRPCSDGTIMSSHRQLVALLKSQHHIIDTTNPYRALDNSIEDRLHVRRGVADDAEHFGSCRLMLQGLAQFCVALF